MKERVKFAVVAAMLMTLVGMSWLLPLRYIVEDGPVAGTLLSLLLSTVITAFSVLFIRHEHRNAREGYPLMDERSRAVRAQTGNYAFFISAALVLVLFAYSVSGLNIYGEAEMQAGEVLFTALIIMVSVYLGIWTLMTLRWRMD